ncbi:T9SS type A sorting domain-containing protein [bacterium]|nr:T9SS type A sorting domain-containing protein [bacterium]
MTLRIVTVLIVGLLAGAGPLSAQAPSEPVRIGSSTAGYHPTLGIPRWKAYMPASDPDRLYVTYANGSRRLSNMSITTDGGATWSSEEIQIDPEGYLDMHLSVFGRGDDLYTTFPTGDGAAFRKFDGPIASNDDGGAITYMDGTNAHHRSNIMVDDNGRIWLFTRQSYADTDENVKYNYSDDGGQTWVQGQAFATNHNSVRFGSMPYVDGSPALVVLYLADDRGFEYYRWDGTRFVAEEDYSIFADNFKQVRAFTHNVVNDTTFHLIFGLGNDLHHVWKHFNDGQGAWNHEIIESSNTTEDMDWRPSATVRGDDLYVFYTRKSSSSDASAMIYYKKWSQSGESWTEPVLVSTGGADSYNLDPNTCFAVPENSPYVPVVWSSGSGPFDIYFSKIVVDDPPPSVSIDCPSGTFSQQVCSGDDVCVPLAVSGAGEVTVDMGGATWSNNALCLTPDTSGLYALTVTAVSGADTARCVVSAQIDVTPSVVMACPPDTVELSSCTAGEFAFGLPIANQTQVHVAGAQWANDTLTFTADTSGVYTFEVTADGECGSVACSVMARVEIGRPVAIECPGGALDFALCSSGEVAIPLPITAQTQVMVDGAVWRDDTLRFVADSSGTYRFDVFAESECGSDACVIVAHVDIAPAVSIQCPVGGYEFASCYPGEFAIPLQIYNAGSVDVVGATWNNDELIFSADSSGTYAFPVTAESACGSASCVVTAQVEIGPSIDLYLSDADVQVSEIEAAPGDTVTIMAVVHSDVQSSMVGSVPVQFYDDDPEAGGAMIGEQMVYDLAGGESDTVAVAYVVSGPFPRTIHVVVDRNGEVAECSNDNNFGTVVIERVQATDGAVVGSVVLDDGSSAVGVEVRLLAGDGRESDRVYSDGSGYYEFTLLSPGEYFVDVDPPVGFGPVGEATVAVTLDGNTAQVDFVLRDVSVRDIGDYWWWKRQVEAAYVDDPMGSMITRDTIDLYGQMIYEHFCNRTDGYALAIEGVTYEGSPARALSTDDMYYHWFEDQEGTFEEKARKYFLANLINVVSGRMSQQAVVSQDGATLAQAITYLGDEYMNGNPDDPSLQANLMRIFSATMIRAGEIPLSTPTVLYKTGGDDPETPDGFALEQNYPNPFNPTTTIAYSIPNRSHVLIQVFNVTGQVVRTLVDEELTAGAHDVVWDGRSDQGMAVGSGVYLYRITADTYTAGRKMMLLK